MKTIASLILVLFCSSNAFAAHKVCTGRPGDNEIAGLKMRVSVDAAKITLDGADYYQGEFAANGVTGTFKNGKAFVQYDGSVDGSFETISVDKDLLSFGAKGIIRIHSISEGEITAVFDCEEADPLR